MAERFLVAEDLRKRFSVGGTVFSSRQEFVHALNGMSFELQRGETLGIVGESGCGKSTAARVILRLVEPSGGRLWFKGVDVFGQERRAMRQMRRHMQLVYQDPYASLDPRMTVEEIIGEPLAIYGLGSREERSDRVGGMMRKVGLKPEQMRCYPAEFSGGQRQRIVIARALILQPELVIADEPVSSLDVSIRAQVLNLLQDLKEEFGLSYIFISHDLSVVKYLSDRVAVMYLGRIVEMAGWEEFYAQPRHPYTEALLSAIPLADPVLERKRKRIILQGDVPSPLALPAGCTFHQRCPVRQPRCREEVPPMREIGPGHFLSCHFR